MNRPTIAALITGLLIVPIQSVAAQSLSEGRISRYGLALPKEQATLRSNFDGQIRRVYVTEGQAVRKGDLLIEFECGPAEAREQVAKLEAAEEGSLLAARAELQFARVNLDRISRLVEQKAVSEHELSESRLRMDRAKAEYRMALERQTISHARHELAAAELEEFRLRAPFDGEVSRVSVNAGDSVTSDIDLLHLISINMLRIEIHLTLDEAEHLQVGQTCQLRVDSPFSSLVDAVIVYRSSMIEATTGTLRFVFEVDNRQYGLPAGFAAELNRS